MDGSDEDLARDCWLAHRLLTYGDECGEPIDDPPDWITLPARAHQPHI